MFFFLPIVSIIYFILPGIKAKNLLLLLSSLLFYAWGNPYYLSIMLFSIVINYFLGLLLSVKDKDKLALVLSIIFNLGLLFSFKYLGFTVKIASKLFKLHISVPNTVLPIGISFYTFQALSYIIDAYRDKTLIQKNPLNLGLYIAFFVQLVAGPIVRYTTIKEKILFRKSTLEGITRGLQRLIIGLGKKVLLANTLANVVDKVYDLGYSNFGTYYAWLITISYALQIYYDFSGYSDMAIGLGGIFGFEFLENFKHPYAMQGIGDFWHKWHISLSTWFRDYVYIPLGGNRCSPLRANINRYIVFFLTGLWHGASFNFIFWGLVHGTLLSIEKSIFGKNLPLLRTIKATVWKAFMLVMVILLWVLFRNGTLTTIAMYFKLFGLNFTRYFGEYKPIVNYQPMLDLYITKSFYFTLGVSILFCFPWWKGLKAKLTFLHGKIQTIKLCSRYIALFAILVMSMSSLAMGSYNPFIYFRF